MQAKRKAEEAKQAALEAERKAAMEAEKRAAADAERGAEKEAIASSKTVTSRMTQQEAVGHLKDTASSLSNAETKESGRGFLFNFLSH